MKRFLQSILILIALIVLAISTLSVALVVIHYKNIKERTPVARYFPGTIVDEYQGVWAHNIAECNIEIDKSSMTFIKTRENYPVSRSIRFQCDLIKFP